MKFRPDRTAGCGGFLKPRGVLDWVYSAMWKLVHAVLETSDVKRESRYMESIAVGGSSSISFGF